MTRADPFFHETVLHCAPGLSMATREKKHREMQQAWRFVFSEIRCEMQQVTISQYILRVLSSVSHGFSSAKTVPEMVRKM